MIAPDLDLELPEELGTLHLIGIGGAGMSALARMFLESGHRVTGSDRSDSAGVQLLRELGAEIAIGHARENLPDDVDTVVVTGALWQDNPEYVAALERGIPVLHRANALAWLTRGERLISVAGAHGKTTSTGMAVTALLGLGVEPGFVNGGVVAGLDRSSRIGSDEFFVIEADESDKSFLIYDTAVALITNIDDDHLEVYGDAEGFIDAFVRFADSATEAVVISADDPGARAVRERLTHRDVITFGRAEDADVRLVSVGDEGPVAFTVAIGGAQYDAQLAVPGAHNALNAVGVLAVLTRLGFEPEPVLRALEGFVGTGRRFELHDEVRGVRVYDDYAHHPAEVAAALQTARSVVGEGRVIAVHQPHLFSRTQRMAGEFAEVYERLADHTVVLDVYGAREDPIPGVTGALVAERFADADRVSFRPDWADAATRVAEIAREGDLVMTLSCGDVYRIIPQLLTALEESPES